MRAPRVSVCVASHERPLRLRWLLNALAEQTLDQSAFEVVVATDSRDETERLLAEHPLAEAGILRTLHRPRPQTAASLRNAAWREARGALIAFTDDDCRPDPRWLESLLAAADPPPAAVLSSAGRGGLSQDSGEVVILQGRTEPDPDEAGLLVASGFHRTVRVDPPDPAAQTCNIAYPRSLLEMLGGFDESLPAAEDTELAARAQDAGAAIAAVPEAAVFHAVEPGGIRTQMRSQWRYRALPTVIARHPRLRRQLTLGLFWKPTHLRLLLLAGALAVLRRHPVAAFLALAAWGAGRRPSYGSDARGIARSVAELPGHAAIDAAEVAACAIGSAEARTLVL